MSGTQALRLPVRPGAPRRRGRRVALVARYPERDPAMPQFISNHGLRMVEAALRRAAPPGLELRVWDLQGGTLDAVADELIAYDPDVVGCSAYLWSFAFLMDLAERLKADDPARLLVFGGPSARPSMLGQPPFRARQACVDVLAINDGELSFAEIVAAGDRSAAGLARVAGLALPAAGATGNDSAWTLTAERSLADLNELPSPYEMDLVPGGGLAVLQTYRGCPFTCSFCEWGTLESPRNVRAAAALQREFDGMARQPVQGALLVDAGLNLNPTAFTQLRQAADEHGFFARRSLICEVYPAKVRPEHIAFLGSVGRALVGIGLQSFDNAVLAHVDRSYDEARFEQTLQDLRAVASVAVEIILGLPGDTPANFRRSFNRARALGCALRVYHCVVLPSALMVRAPAAYVMDYDPVTLKMRACLGWPEAELQAACDDMAAEVRRAGGFEGQYFWVFPPPRTA